MKLILLIAVSLLAVNARAGGVPVPPTIRLHPLYPDAVGDCKDRVIKTEIGDEKLYRFEWIYCLKSYIKENSGSADKAKRTSPVPDLQHPNQIPQNDPDVAA